MRAPNPVGVPRSTIGGATLYWAGGCAAAATPAQAQGATLY
jgi:hypothetical protein